MIHDLAMWCAGVMYGFGMALVVYGKTIAKAREEGK